MTLSPQADLADAFEVARRFSPGEYRHMGLRARRWAMVVLDAGKPDEARHQLNEAARFFSLADEFQNLRRVA